MMTAKRRGMVIAINQREALLVVSCYERWFHTSLRCVADGCWIQKPLGLVTPLLQCPCQLQKLSRMTQSFSRLQLTTERQR